MLVHIVKVIPIIFYIPPLKDVGFEYGYCKKLSRFSDSDSYGNIIKITDHSGNILTSVSDSIKDAYMTEFYDFPIVYLET